MLELLIPLLLVAEEHQVLQQQQVVVLILNLVLLWQLAVAEELITVLEALVVQEEAVLVETEALGALQLQDKVMLVVLLAVVRRWVPAVHQAFLEYRQGGMAVSATGLQVIRRLLAGEAVTQEDSGLGKREWAELMAQLGRS